MASSRSICVSLMVLEIQTILFVMVMFSYGNKVQSLRCYCAGHCPDNQPNGTCFARLNSQCFSAVEEVVNVDTGKLEVERTYGCLPPDESGFMQCKGHLVPHNVPKSIACCGDLDLCNKDLQPMYTVRPTSDDISKFRNREFMSYDDSIHQLALLISLSACFIILTVLLVLFYFRCRRRDERHQGYLSEQCDAFLVPGESLKDLIERSVTSGSGSGLPLLVQRTIARQIEMLKSIGKGRYGEVWKARWHGEYVAVKVFFTTEEASWFRETEIYQTVLLRHQNILGYIAADIRGTGSWTQLLLITDYHECGSLHDYLKTHILDATEGVRLAYTAACGISHLHTEILGKQGKPGIAHRDIKSKNILVTTSGTCVIADFGLAVRYNSESSEIDVATNARVGTKRYMAPEVLEELPHHHFDSYKLSDMYSFALVLWEISRRCLTNGFVEDYQVPYFDAVPPDPSFEDMKKVVCVCKTRPTISNRWSTCQNLQVLSMIMHECWHPNPSIRLTSLRVKKTLSKLNPYQDQKMIV